MFDKLKQALNSKAEHVREIRANPGPPDLSVLPAGTGAVGGLGAIAPEVASAYVRMEIRTIRPLDRLGPESSSLIGDKIRSRMRDAGVGDPDLPPGELIPGQNAARMERLRAQGLNDQQLAEIQAKIAEVTQAHEGAGWTVDFANGNHASVQVFDSGSPDGDFVGLQAKFAAQHTRAGTHAMQRNPAEFAVELITTSPYEAYYLPGKLAANGRSHEATASASHLDTMQLDQTLAALAILALHSLEG